MLGVFERLLNLKVVVVNLYNLVPTTVGVVGQDVSGLFGPPALGRAYNPQGYS